MRYLFIFILFGSLSSCTEDELEFNENNCRQNPSFISKLGFDPFKSFFSTSEMNRMGLVLVEAKDTRNLSLGANKIYQDSSWKKAGWLAPIQFDKAGNIFVGPAPFINVLYNPGKDQNILYKVDAGTGKMIPFVKLPLKNTVNEQNPFGIVGLAYLCETNSLYISSIASSDRLSENGIIYQVDAADGKVLDKMENTDALGLGISYISGDRRLYFGKARTPDVYSKIIDKHGNFSGKPQFEFSLEGLGPTGDDKVRKIKSNPDGSLMVYGIEFSFNLVPAREKKETVYHFTYSPGEKKWMLSR